jgi:hypothetical protein
MSKMAALAISSAQGNHVLSRLEAIVGKAQDAPLVGSL